MIFSWTSTLIGCKPTDQDELVKKRLPSPKNEISDDKDSSSDTLSENEEYAIHPKLLFHGGGGLSGLMPTTVDMKPAAENLVRLGVSSEHIHIIKYPHTKNISDIKISVDSQLKMIFAKYPSNAKFDSIGHSLGLLASFISFAELGYLPRIRSIIGIAGVLMRQDEKAIPIGCTKNNSKDLCGDIFDNVLGPSDSVYVLDLINKNSAELQRINRCAIWSKKDGILSPPNAGVFPGGKSVEMPSSWCPTGNFLNPCHLQAKSSQAIYETLKSNCFDNDII